MYQYSLYGDHFLDYNFCLNNKENFVFSFPADTNIYESNLSDYHVAYYAKSLFQQKPITPLTIADLKEDEIKFKQYKIREAYGSIFFDPFKKRYLRLAKQKIDEADYDAKNRDRKQSIIIFDENFRIIAESEVPTNLAFNTLIFSSTGSMYIRVNSSDENALHFARLAYIEKNDAALKQLTNLKTKSIK
jgi:hypothetical protein